MAHSFLFFLIDYDHLMDLPLPSSPLLPLGTEAENQYFSVVQGELIHYRNQNMATTHSKRCNLSDNWTKVFFNFFYFFFYISNKVSFNETHAFVWNSCSHGIRPGCIQDAKLRGLLKEDTEKKREKLELEAFHFQTFHFRWTKIAAGSGSLSWHRWIRASSLRPHVILI